ncbi:MAG: hypothetical protein LBO69_00105 [Ignavibacteria bacterium]|jgi:hypothetical protein|nr:hypothetical protein [Ignavibacteria bacterium]
MNNKTFIPTGIITVIATTSILPNRFITSAGAYASTTDKAIGVAMTGGGAGDAIAVCIHGIAIVETAAAVSSLNSEIRASTDGKAATASTPYLNILPLDTAASGAFIRVKL